MNNSMCHNTHQTVDELRRLKIFRVSHPSDSPDISPCHFWIFGDLKGKLKDCHLQDPGKFLRAFQELLDNITFEQPELAFGSWRDRLRWIIEHDREFFRK
jgi:hypothetical protein